MRCKHCDYLLFNLPRPVCPECGQPFDIEDYSFKPDDVSFHCPFCDQEYYGNDAYGLPWPRRFQCVRCKQPVAAQMMRVVPTHPQAMGMLRDQYTSEGSPWDRRKELGLISAWWETFVQIVRRPATFYRTHSGTSLREAWLFSTISLYIGSLPGLLCGMSMMWGLERMMNTPGSPFALPSLPMLRMWEWASTVFSLTSPLFIQIVSGAISAATIQLALPLLTPDPKPFRDTFHVVMYSFGVQALGLIPMCGGYVAWPWQLGAIVTGVKEIHGISRQKAAFAVLWPVVLILCAALGIVLWGIV